MRRKCLLVALLFANQLFEEVSLPLIDSMGLVLPFQKFILFVQYYFCVRSILPQSFFSPNLRQFLSTYALAIADKFALVQKGNRISEL